MDNSTPFKILMLVGKGTSSKILYNYLSQHFNDIHVITEDKPDRIKFIKNRAKRLGWLTAIGQVIFQLTVPRLLNLSSANRIEELYQQYSLDNTEIENSKNTFVKSVNAKESIQKIQELRPSLIILNGTRIVSKKVLRSIDAKFINTHLGITPLYRGVFGAYWAMVKKDYKNIGTTIHLVDEGIDTGGIIKQVIVKPTTDDNFVTYPILQLGASLSLMKETIEQISQDQLMTISAPPGKSGLWSHPTIFQYVYNRILHGVK